MSQPPAPPLVSGAGGAHAPLTGVQARTLQHLFSSAPPAARERAHALLLREYWRQQRAVTAAQQGPQPSRARQNFTRAIRQQMEELAANDAFARALIDEGPVQIGDLNAPGPAPGGRVVVESLGFTEQEARQYAFDDPLTEGINEASFNAQPFAQRLLEMENGPDTRVVAQSSRTDSDDEGEVGGIYVGR